MRDIPNRINTKIALLFISQTLVFSNPRLLSSFVSTAFEDILSGLPTSEQPYVDELRRGPSRARCSRYSRAPCLHWSDRSAKPFKPIRPGFLLCWSFWRSLCVLAHSSVLAQFYVNRLGLWLWPIPFYCNPNTQILKHCYLILFRWSSYYY